MNLNILRSYTNYFTPLFETTDYFRSLRNENVNERFPEYTDINLQDTLLMTWPFYIIQSMITLIFYSVAISESESIANFMGPYVGDLDPTTHFFMAYCYTLTISLIAQPLYDYFVFLVERFYLSIFTYLMKCSEPREVAEKIVLSSFSSKLFNVVPGIGDLFSKLFSFRIMYMGLIHYVGCTRMLAFLILVLPPVVILLSISFIGIVASTL